MQKKKETIYTEKRTRNEQIEKKPRAKSHQRQNLRTKVHIYKNDEHALKMRK